MIIIIKYMYSQMFVIRYLGDEIYLYEDRKFYYIRGSNFTELSPPKGYIYIRYNK